MTCKKCNGRGWYENPKYPLPGNWAGEPSKKCGKCKGMGYIVGNWRDVLDLLKVLENHDRFHRTEIRQAIEFIEGA